MAFLEALEQENNYGEPLATSYHSKSMGTVDYIWHIEELVLVRVLETLTVDVLRKTGGLASEKWGSNHPTLVCALAFADDGSSSWPGSSPLIVDTSRSWCSTWLPNGWMRELNQNRFLIQSLYLQKGHPDRVSGCTLRWYC